MMSPAYSIGAVSNLLAQDACSFEKVEGMSFLRKKIEEEPALASSKILS